MDLLDRDESVERFAAYVDGLASVIGHADRIAPLRDYCTGLMLPGDRKSVEPMAAKTAPGRTAAQHQSLLHLSAIRSGRTRGCWAKCARWCCRRSSGMGRSRLGSSMIRAFPSRGSIQSEYTINIVGSLASRRIVKLRCRCR